MKRILAISLLVIAGCGGKAGTTTSPSPERDVRLLDASDVALRPVVFAAATHIFDRTAPPSFGFGGVYVNKRLETSLTADVRNYITRNGGFRETSRPADCDRDMDVDPPTRSRPGTSGTTGGAPNPPAQPKRTTASQACNRGVAALNFTSVRIASDTAYVEMQAAGTGGTTWCLPLTVDKEAGGWAPADRSVRFSQMKPSKIGQCGK
jgi:hypothetical protein